MKDAEKNSDRQGQDAPVSEAGPPVRRRSRRRAAAIWGMRGMLILLALAAVSALMVVGQQMHAPDWLRERVAARLERGMGGAQIRFGDVSIIIHQGWRPRLRLRDVTLSDAEGHEIARVQDLRASLSMRNLLRGSIRPKRITLNGARINLRRDRDGAFSLRMGTESALVEGAPDLADLIEQGDDVFLSPALSALSSVEMDGITLEYSDLRQNRVWTMDGGRVLVTRSDDTIRLATSFSVLGGGAESSEIEANYTSLLGSPEATFGFTVTDLPAEDIAGQSLALTWLQELRAPISGAMRGSIDGAGALGQVYTSFRIGAGVLQPTPQTRAIPFDNARAYFTYDPATQSIAFDEVSVASPWGSAVAEGRAFLDGLDQGALSNLAGQFRLSGIRVNPADVFPEPLELSGAELDFQLKLAPFRLKLGQVTVQHEGRRLRLSGGVMAAQDGWDVDVDAQVDQLTPAQILGYWPDTVAAKPRKWVTENLLDGQLSDLDLAVRLRAGEKPEIYADFDFDQAHIRITKTLPPLVDAQGQASLIGGRFSVTAQQGWMHPDAGGAVDAAGTSFIIPDIGIKKAAPGIARIMARGSITSALSLLDRPPLSIMSKANLPVDLAEGEMQIEGTLALPLKDKVKLDDMQFHFAGQLDDMRSDKLVPDVTVSAGRLEIAGDQTEVRISGDGLFGEVPMRADWRQPIGGPEGQRSRLTGQIALSPQLMDEIGADLPPGFLTGSAPAEVTVDLGGDAPPVLSARSDTVGAVLNIPELGWRKSARTAGDLQVQATLGQNLRVDTLRLTAAGLKARGSISFDGNQQFQRLSLSSFDLGNWLSVPAELVARPGRSPDIRVLGGRMDMRGATFGSGSSGGGAGQASKLDVKLDRLQITDALALTSLTGNFNTAGGVSGPFTARVNGGTAVTGQVTPRGARSSVILQSKDAGGVLRSAGMLTQAHGGSFWLALEPVGAPGNYDAALKIGSTSIKDAPAMAALLNAISLVGLVTVLSGSAVGPSIGLSFDGTVDTNRGRMNLRGAISPIYLVNAIGSVVTRKGEGIFAFNYTLRGALDDPKVSVNPLSGLAPLFLRNLFRAPRAKLPAGAQGTAALPSPPKPAKKNKPHGRDHMVPDR